VLVRDSNSVIGARGADQIRAATNTLPERDRGPVWVSASNPSAIFTARFLPTSVRMVGRRAGGRSDQPG